MNNRIILLLSLLLFTTNALKYPVVKREASPDALKKFHGAVLIKNGLQTTCELALMHNKAAFVSASCFNAGSSQKIHDLSPYQVAFDTGGSESARGTVAVDKVVINPHYNRTTFANNIAVIFFNSHAKKLWSNNIVKYPEVLSDRIYVRRSMDDEDTQAWNDPMVINDTSTDDGCKQASALFESNPADLWCNPKSIPSPMGGSCHVPYGVVYGAIKSDIAVTAIYSHSAIYGSDLCGDSKAYHYYTVLSNYLKWATGVVSDGFDTLSSDSSFSASNDPNYTMKNSTASSPSGVSLISGDIYARNDKSDPGYVEDASEEPEEDSSEESTDDSTDGSEEDPGDETLDQNSSSDLTKGQIIGMAVGIPLGMIILLIALFFLYKWWNRHRKTVAWDPDNEAINMRTIALDFDLSQPNTANEHLPAYSRVDSEDLAVLNLNRKS